MSDNAESRKQVAKDRRAELAKAQARRNAMLALEFPPMRDFDEPALEWRRLFSELFGTFLLVLAGAGGGLLVIQTHGAVTATAAVVAPGLTVMAVILFMGAVSGAHLNPCVSLAFALRRDFPWRRVPGYIVFQLAGAILACLFLSAVFGDGSGLGATRPGVGFDAWQAMLIEAVLTLGLVSTILGTSSGAQNVGPLGALAVGGYIALAGLWSGPVSGASMNPARSFAPDLVTGDFSSLWVYLVGPIVGALLAVVAAIVLRGRGGGVVGRASASGRLSEESLDSVESD